MRISIVKQRVSIALYVQRVSIALYVQRVSIALYVQRVSIALYVQSVGSLNKSVYPFWVSCTPSELKFEVDPILIFGEN